MDSSLYNVLLKVYIANDNPFSPSEFLEEMTVNGVSPNQVFVHGVPVLHCCQVIRTSVCTSLREHLIC